LDFYNIKAKYQATTMYYNSNKYSMHDLILTYITVWPAIL